MFELHGPFSLESVPYLPRSNTMKNVPKKSHHHFCPRSTAVALGSVWSLIILLTGWVAGLTSMSEWGNRFVSVLSSIYMGYDATFVGGIIGGIWGFGFGSLLGLFFALLYNRIISD